MGNVTDPADQSGDITAAVAQGLADIAAGRFVRVRVTEIAGVTQRLLSEARLSVEGG